MILDVIDVEAELAEADQVMEQLPDDTSERISRRQMEYDDFALALGFHFWALIVVRARVR